MTPKQILDSFSETLMQDERILSAQERALVASLLQHAKAAENANPDTHEAVRAVIASAVGETVAQRAFAVLGGSIVERIVESSSSAVAETGAGRPEFTGTPTVQGKEPQHPGAAPLKQPQHPGAAPLKQPQHPGSAPLKQPQHPGAASPKQPQHPGAAPLKQPQHPGAAPLKQPQHPGAAPLKEPQHPGASVKTVVTGSTVALAERPEVLRANCVVLDEFLAPQELEALTRFTLEHEADFQASELYSPTA